MLQVGLKCESSFSNKFEVHPEDAILHDYCINFYALIFKLCLVKVLLEFPQMGYKKGGLGSCSKIFRCTDIGWLLIHTRNDQSSLCWTTFILELRLQKLLGIFFFTVFLWYIAAYRKIPFRWVWYEMQKHADYRIKSWTRNFHLVVYGRIIYFDILNNQLSSEPV